MDIVAGIALLRKNFLQLKALLKGSKMESIEKLYEFYNMHNNSKSNHL